MYRRLCEGLENKGKLILATDDVYTHIKDESKDYYLSTFLYTEEQKQVFLNTGTVSGITDVVSDKIWWDFDSEFEPEEAKKSTISLVERLLNYGIAKEDISIAFSGNKGFAVEVKVNTLLSPKEVKNIAFEVAKDLKHLDNKMYNAARIFRIIATKHNKTKLYKTPLTYSQIKELSTDSLMNLAKSYPALNEEFRWNVVTLPKDLYTKSQEVTVIVPKKEQVDDIDFTKKAKGWSNCKWSLLNGNFREGERHYPVLAIIATCKNLNYPKDTAYYMAKSASKLSVQRNGGSELPKEEIWREVESVYSDNWQGGTFSCKDGKSVWLTHVCNELGPHKCKHDDEKIFTEFGELSQVFNKFATEIDKNKIKTGIPELDNNVTLVTSTLVGLLGNPGSGKTSLSLNILNNCSKNNIPSVFFSMDMGIPLVYLKLAQKHKGYTHDKIFDMYKRQDPEIEEINKIIEDNYKNVKFSFKSGLNVEEMKESIIKHQEKTGQKIKLVVVDYLECISGPYSDSTANTAIIANQLKDLANETETCVLLLLQTQKHAAAPDEPLLSMKNIKGSSVIEQAASVILTLWREGYSAKYADMDKYISMATVKDRFNSLWKYDFKWNGLKGLVTELDDYERDELAQLRDRKKQDKAGLGTGFNH